MTHSSFYPQTYDRVPLPVFDAYKYGNPMARRKNPLKDDSTSRGTSATSSQPQKRAHQSHLEQSWGFQPNSVQPANEPTPDSNFADVTAKVTDAQSDKHLSNAKGNPSSNSHMRHPEFEKEVDGLSGIHRIPHGASQPPHEVQQDQGSSSQIQKTKASAVQDGNSEVMSAAPWGLVPIQPDGEGQLQLRTPANASITTKGLSPNLQIPNNTKAPDIGSSEAKQSQDSVKPAVYETLKKPEESPIETMRRLQAAKQLEIMNRIHTYADKRGQNTANLAELKNLRRAISPEPSDSPAVTSQPTSNAPEATLTAPLPRVRRPSLDSPSRLAVKVPGSVQSALSSMNPNVSRFPSRLGQYQDCTNGINLKPTVNGQSHQPQPSRTQTEQIPQRNNWATPAEIKSSAWSVDSNAAGSLASEGSMCHMGIDYDLGKLVRPQSLGVHEASLVGWDGNFAPPPVDWEQRPRFGNDQEHFKADFRNWLGQAVQHTLGVDTTPKLRFERVPPEVVLDLNLHPDGVGFVRRHATINASNAKHYGYNFSLDSFPEPNQDQPADFDGDWDVDLSLAENLRYREETANDLIAKKMQLVERATRHYEAYLEERRVSQEQANALINASAAQPAEFPRPKVNLYLRPALACDIPAMTEILNWHIKYGVRTSELLPITEHDMRQRLDLVKQSKLPFIVAIERTRNKGRQKRSRRPDNARSDMEPHSAMNDEHVVGWASATDWSASDYVECISADLELYVAHNYRQRGIGRCLMDAILDATDRGYLKKSKCTFTVAPEMRHMFSRGGMRDLHKIIFQVRSYHSPLSREMQLKRGAYTGTYDNLVNGKADRDGDDDGWGGPGNSKRTAWPQPQATHFVHQNEKSDDLEDDYAVWLKNWLESFGFVEEGRLNNIGAKNRRFLDLVYLTRETNWQPNDKNLPDYSQYPI